MLSRGVRRKEAKHYITAGTITDVMGNILWFPALNSKHTTLFHSVSKELSEQARLEENSYFRATQELPKVEQ